MALLATAGALALAAATPVRAADPDGLRDGYSPCPESSEVCFAPDAPAEPYDPFFDVDWSLGLRGAYVKDAAGTHYDLMALPSVSLTHEGTRWNAELSADAELAKPSNDIARLSALRFTAAADYTLDSVTVLDGEAHFTLTKASATAPGLASTVAEAPVVVSGGVEGEATRILGLFELGLRGSIERTVNGPTTMADATITDNTERNTWDAGAGLRLGYRVTPILTAFLDASADRSVYDLPSSALLVKLDGTTYTLKTGIAGNWHDVFTAEASVGIALRRFDDASLPEVAATLYNASLTFRPDETLTLSANFGTSIGAPGATSGGTASVTYTAAGSVKYQATQLLALRATLDWHAGSYAGSASVDEGYGLGVGADYELNRHTLLSADYAFAHRTVTPEPPEDTHRVSVGLTLKR